MPWWAYLGTTNNANQVDQGGGWLYHLLTKAGVSPDTASTVTDLIIRPLSILFVVVVALVAARYGAKIIRRLLERVANQAASRSGSQQAGRASPRWRASWRTSGASSSSSWRAPSSWACSAST